MEKPSNQRQVGWSLWRPVIVALVVGLTAGAIWLGSLQRAVPETISEPEIGLVYQNSSSPLPTVSSLSPISQYELRIPQIDVHVPIILDVDGTDEATYLRAIERGVAQYRGTAMIGEKGNTFLFGHSSYYQNKPGQYKDIFKRLDELVLDQELTIEMQATTYTYRVIRTGIIDDSDLSILDQPKDPQEEIVTLMTCWPPGTITSRYIIQARRI